MKLTDGIRGCYVPGLLVAVEGVRTQDPCSWQDPHQKCCQDTVGFEMVINA
jgi:hypothetical protein